MYSGLEQWYFMDINPEIKFPIETFKDRGFFIAKASNIKPLIDLQSFLVNSLEVSKFDNHEKTNSCILNQFHSIYPSSESCLNDLRMKIMTKIDQSKKN